MSNRLMKERHQRAQKIACGTAQKIAHGIAQKIAHGAANVALASLSISALALFGIFSYSMQADAAQPVKQIYTLSSRQERSQRLSATGVPGYIVTARGNNRGLYITSASGGLAGQIGLTAGDVLLQLNNRVVQSARDADRILDTTPSGQLRVVFVRQGDRQLDCYTPTISYTNIEPQDGAALTDSTIVARATGGGVTLGVTSRSVANQPFSAATLERYMFELVNSDRKANGSSPIAFSSSLSAVARAHAEDMVQRGYFDHKNPDGLLPMDRARAAGINAPVFENIATKVGLMTPAAMVKGCEDMMMAEPPNQFNHRSNILNPEHACVGIGIARLPNGGVMCAQEFSSASLP
ncbi:MAG TPA: CAP domain-containing protein [Candidatus Obscuribacterales bacterium]